MEEKGAGPENGGLEPNALDVDDSLLGVRLVRGGACLAPAPHHQTSTRHNPTSTRQLVAMLHLRVGVLDWPTIQRS